MSNETKRLAIMACFCFLPTALIGLFLQKNSEERALLFYRLSIYIFLVIFTCAGSFAVIEGGRLIKVMMSFY